MATSMSEQHKEETTNQEICQKLVNREIIHCCSIMVSELLKSNDDIGDYRIDEILDLCTALDYESAAYDEGWRIYEDPIGDKRFYNEDQTDEVNTLTSEAQNWQELCEEQSIDPYNREVFEHWIVTKWFAEKLQAHGEIVGELFDFHIWGRCTTGQAILLDGVIRRIASEMEILAGQKNDWSK